MCYKADLTVWPLGYRCTAMVEKVQRTQDCNPPPNIARSSLLERIWRGRCGGCSPKRSHIDWFAESTTLNAESKFSTRPPEASMLCRVNSIESTTGAWYGRDSTRCRHISGRIPRSDQPRYGLSDAFCRSSAPNACYRGIIYYSWRAACINASVYLCSSFHCDDVHGNIFQRKMPSSRERTRLMANTVEHRLPLSAVFVRQPITWRRRYEILLDRAVTEPPGHGNTQFFASKYLTSRSCLLKFTNGYCRRLSFVKYRPPL